MPGSNYSNLYSVKSSPVLSEQVKKAVQKTARRKLEQDMSDEQIQREKSLQSSQLEAISRMITSNASLQSSNDVDVDMVAQQLKLYIE